MTEVKGTPAEPLSAEKGVEGRLPDVMIIGAAKSGTTTLYHYLRRHPSLFMVQWPKEPEFFSNPEIQKKGLGWYKNLFRKAGRDQLCGEASTTYTRWPHTLDSPALIHETVGPAKFIYIMREPVSRAYSHYMHHMRQGVTMTFEEALERDQIYIDCSMYMNQIERYLRFYRKEDFLFLFLDELNKDCPGTLDRVQEFLEVPRHDLIAENPILANKGGVDHYIRSRTVDPLLTLPGVRNLKDRLPRSLKSKMFSFLKNSVVGKSLSKKGQPPPMKEETRTRLRSLFREPNQNLAEFLGRDLQHWIE